MWAATSKFGTRLRQRVCCLFLAQRTLIAMHRDAAKKPGRALFVGVGALVLFVFMTVTVRLMLGMNDDQNFEYLSRGI